MRVWKIKENEEGIWLEEKEAMNRKIIATDSRRPR
jgi:hypothetical protein